MVVFFRLSASYIGAIFQNAAYYLFRIEPTRYANAVVLVNSQCNSRCSMCTSYTVKANPTDMNFEQLCSVLNKLKRHNPSIKVSFVGGEPLLRADIYEVFRHCNRIGLLYSVVSNGILLDSKVAARLLECQPFAVHISLDSLQRTVYKSMRGVDRLDRVKENIFALVQAKKQAFSNSYIGIKTVVASENIGELNELVTFAESAGVAGLHFQPILSPSSDHAAAKMMPSDQRTVEQVANDLLSRSGKAGRLIVNSRSNIKGWGNYFAGRQPKRRFCPTSMQNLFIQADGTVKLCERYEVSIGNLVTANSVEDLIGSEDAVSQRRMMTGCQKQCSFIFSRGIGDYLSLAVRHIRGARAR